MSPATVDLTNFPPRDFRGYGRDPPNPNWPNGAKIAVNFVINYEEGGENTLDNGDAQAEAMLQEVGPKAPLQGERDIPMETQFEYGSRRGMWRLLNLFEKHKMAITIYAVGKAYEQNPEIAKACEEGGHETASHCYRWVDYALMDAESEERLIRQAVESFKKTSPTARVPVGWYYGRPSPRSRALVSKVYRELGLELLYQADTYADDLPYWIPDPVVGASEGLLMLPYTYDVNDFKFFVAPGFGSSMAYFEHAKNAFDTLYEEGQEGHPAYLTVALHARVIGRPGRFPAIKQFVEYISAKPDVWIATREQIARHWKGQFPYQSPSATA
ncbi:carbohydrate esterase family 4 protein [Hypholoma sublateritium FD-334 SS-4]|uniref:Carbohydrate esterase family 4 protein n=1 Tax=Hypholoma sublateritium (strain FD-334 SS-4) TaxID=945553 RepID=A0A0D2MEB4_HYPSF|nr:carbohydrate esterase family 4 protein [Hypholoma sublateritium FD-334 SS-4]